MICSSCYTFKEPQASAGSSRRRAADAQADRDALHGTWDFLWPRGKTVRIAVQQLSDVGQEIYGDGQPFEHIVQAFIEQTRRWNGRAGISLEVLERQLPAVRRERERRLRFTSDQAPPWLDYDVLVSFEPLPVEIELPWLEGGRPQIEELHFPSASLGSFHTRAEFGIPTLQLGVREHFSDKTRYFGSDEFKHWTVHELGHVLGLPHIHQHPWLTAKKLFRPMGEIIDSIESSTGVRVSEDFVERAILERWPVMPRPDALPYSTWWQLPAGSPGLEEVLCESVMSHWLLRRFLIQPPSETGTLSLTPSPADLELLQRMYGSHSPDQR